MSVDLGLYPPQAEDESTDDEFTENVWWETADNLAFVNDEGGPPITPVDQVNQNRCPLRQPTPFTIYMNDFSSVGQTFLQFFSVILYRRVYSVLKTILHYKDYFA